MNNDIKRRELIQLATKFTRNFAILHPAGLYPQYLSKIYKI
jgi:hypothetical protein